MSFANANQQRKRKAYNVRGAREQLRNKRTLPYVHEMVAIVAMIKGNMRFQI